MVHRRFVTIMTLIVVALAVNGNTWARDSLEQAKASAPLAPAGTAFTYQGQLNGTGGPVTDFCDFQFGLWDAFLGGNPIGPTLTLTGVGVTDGLFTVALNFGPAFDGNARWLEIAVRCPGGTGTYNTLTPRQELTPTPYSIDADMLDGLHADAFALGGHIHWGETWSGTGTGLTLQGGNVGLSGSGSEYGVQGLSDERGAGVYGYNSADGVGVTAESHEGDPLAAVSGETESRVFTVDNFGRVYAVGYVPLLPRAEAPASNSFHMLDSSGDVGAGSSATIGVDGLPVIAYLDVTNADLKVAHCDYYDDCSSVSTTAVDTGSVGDSFPSVTIGADGLPLIAYISGGLKVAHCEDIACTTATLTLLHSGGGDVDPAVTIGTDGLGLISFGSGVTTAVAHCANTACTSATISTLETSWTTGTSVTIGADGRGLISYINSIVPGLTVAHCDNVACTSATISIVTLAGDAGTSVTTGADGLGLITFYGDFGWGVMHCDDAPCTSVTGTYIGSDSSDGLFPSVTIGADGLALISSYHATDATHGTLLVAHCYDVACSGAVITTLASSGGSVGLSSSVTIGADGLPLISYYDETNGDLWAAHCADPFCVNYFRRR